MLHKNERLSKDHEIKNVLRLKQYESQTPLLYLLAKDNFLKTSRLVVVPSKKQGNPTIVGKATTRNRLRRIFQAAYLQIRHNFVENVDLLVFPRRAAVGMGLNRAVDALRESLSGFSFFKNEKNC